MRFIWSEDKTRCVPLCQIEEFTIVRRSENLFDVVAWLDDEDFMSVGQASSFKEAIKFIKQLTGERR